ncbi:MAG: hypothetical protein PUP91_36955, partial [Rhizonema sp. PD37]|nr:hypothetical protein [Rhizonema sp. PD37]
QTTLVRVQEGIGRLESRQLQYFDKKSITDNEFRVYSQWGEDGIIQFLLRHIQIPRKVFVEFGVQNYTESNTRFLLVNNNWAGLLIEANEADVNYIKQDPIYWQYNLKVVNYFITKDNINSILLENGITGEIGLLSVDIDGNDYWIWEKIDVIKPAIVITEYNFRFGKEESVSVPYNEHFVRAKAHYSTIYYGVSLKALFFLAKQKGYAFVGCNSAGNNAFFVRQDLKPDCIKELTVEEGYVAGMFRESRDENNNLLYLSHLEEHRLISSLPLVEVE